MISQTLVIGLDGFDPDLAQYWMQSGDLPNLRYLAETGFFAPLKSTIPPFTYPAWSSLITGENPGKHGMIDFAVRQPGTHSEPGTYDVHTINSSFRKCPTIFNRLSKAGKRVCAMGFPTTYPPEPVNGILISGFDSPLAVNADKSFCYPPEIWNELKTRVHPFTLAGIQELNTGGRWHIKAAAKILQTISDRTEIAEHLIQKENWDLFAIVFSESDTAAHHFWAAHDPESPRHPVFKAKYGDSLNHVLKNVYKNLDNAVGRLLPYGKNVFIVSDHGSGGTGDTLLSINRLLAEHGYFQYHQQQSTGNSAPASRGIIKTLARLLPASTGQWLFRHGPQWLPQKLETRQRLASAHLKHCLAFSDELNYFPSIWIHDQRFPMGKTMDDSEKTQLCHELRETLLQQINPETKEPIFNKVYFRDELYHGSAMGVIPDLILEPALIDGYSTAIWNAPGPGPILEKLPEIELTGRKGGSMNGSHRQYGVLFTNDTTRFSPRSEWDIVTVGKVLRECVMENVAGEQDNTNGGDYQAEDLKPGQEYTPEEQAEVSKRLRDLGYL